MRAKRFITNSLCHVLLAILSTIWVLPIFYVILTSFRAETGTYKSYIFPKEYTLDNYIKLFNGNNLINFPRWFMNTFIVALFSMIIAAFMVIAVSYVMSRLRFKMRKPFLNIALIIGMFPGFMSMIAVYYILKALGLTEGAMIRVALIMVYSGGSGMGFYIAKGFFDTIPKQLDEAACIDGATKFQVFTKIIMPLSKPIIVYTVLTSFMGPWLDFIFAKVICGTQSEFYTVSIGLWKMLEKEYILNCTCHILTSKALI